MGIRETQVIGLTDKAETFISSNGLEEVVSDSYVLGMFEEVIPLRNWIWKRKNIIVREVLQESPWSSGPMLFYCLEFEYPNNFKCKGFEWIHDPTLSSEYDSEAGSLWV